MDSRFFFKPRLPIDARSINAVRVVDCSQVVKNTIPVIQQIAVVALFMAIFTYTINGRISEILLGAFDIATASIGGFIAHNTGNLTSQVKIENATTIYLLAGTLVVLAPVMRTLTESYSDDTVAFLVMLLFSVHVVFHEYRMRPMFTGAGSMLSLNAGIFASVLLASRMSSDVYVFEILGLGALLLVCFPALRQFLMRESERLNTVLAGIMVLVAFILLLPLSTTVATVYIGSVGFIGFVCPFGLILVQRYKLKINGPWDIASIHKIDESNGRRRRSLS